MRKAFKKRRNGLIKKAMQLSILCDANVCLSIFNKNDFSMVQYSSDGRNFPEKDLIRFDEDIHEYVQLTNNNYENMEQIDVRVLKQGHINQEDSETE